MVVVVHISVCVSVQMVISWFSFICEDLLGFSRTFIHSFIAFICVADVIISDYFTKITNQLNENTCKAFAQLQFRSLCGNVFCILCVMCTVFSGLFFFFFFFVFSFFFAFVFASVFKTTQSIRNDSITILRFYVYIIAGYNSRNVKIYKKNNNVGLVVAYFCAQTLISFIQLKVLSHNFSLCFFSSSFLLFFMTVWNRPSCTTEQHFTLFSHSYRTHCITFLCVFG